MLCVLTLCRRNDPHGQVCRHREWENVCCVIGWHLRVIEELKLLKQSLDAALISKVDYV
jgi:hypothetical protein